MTRSAGLLSLGLLASSLLLQASPARAESSAEGPPPAHARVVDVYDGDTFTLDTGDRIRLRWVNTPELKPYEEKADEARALTAGLLMGKEVTLSYGPNTRDGYGRLIASVKVGDQDLALALVEKGLGHIFAIPPVDEDLTDLVKAQGEARKAGLGIWSVDGYQGSLHITSFHANGRGDERLDPNTEYLRVCNVSAEPLSLAGYKLTDITNNTWTLPDVTVPAGYTFEIRSGHGDDQTDIGSQLKIYLDSDTPVWNNDRDRATLLDPNGKVMDTRDHAPKSRQN